MFSENSASGSSSTQASKAQMKAFMVQLFIHFLTINPLAYALYQSSKVEKVRKDVSPEEDESSEDDGDDET